MCSSFYLTIEERSKLIILKGFREFEGIELILNLNYVNRYISKQTLKKL